MADKPDLSESQKRHLLNERDDQVREGLALTERAEKDGGFAEYFDDKAGLLIEDEVLRGHTAIVMNNAKKWMSSMNEATLSLTTGGYRDHVFSIIRASYPNNPINRLVSVQPQSKRNGTIYWLNYVIGKTRGAFKKGQTLFDANNGWTGVQGYTDQAIYNDALGNSVANATQGVTLSETPVVPATVQVNIAQGTGIVVRDTGNGTFTLVNDGGTGRTLSSSSINYSTGVISLVFDMALTASNAITASYATDLEGSYNLPQIDVELQSTGTQAKRRPIQVRISMESLQDGQAEMGMDMGSLLVQTASQALLTDSGAEVVRDLWDMAGTAVATFDTTPSVGLGRAEHFRDINYPIQQASGAITDATQRGEATWLIVDQKALNVLKTIGAPQFVPAPGTTSKAQGLVFVGTFDGLEVFRYKFMSSFPGASANGNILVGYKGEDFWDTGYVWAPYQTFYTNGPDERADLTRRQSWAIRYAKKAINANMYKRIALAAS